VKEQGIVKWFNGAKGYGFIQRSNGEDVFVHFSAIESNGYKTLNEGEAVEFECQQGPKGLNAAGLADRARMERDPVWTQDMIVAALLDFRVREGRWPSWREWAQAKGRRNRDRPASWSVVRAFGSWSAAIEFASGATDPSVATERRALSSARRLAAVEPSLTKSAPAMRRDFAAPVTDRDDELTLTQTAA